MPAPRWAALLQGNPDTTDERYLARAFMVERICHRNVAAHYKESTMLKYAIIFAIISLIAGLFGFTGIAAGAAGIAKVLFILFLVLAVVFVVLAAMGVGAARKMLK